MPGKGVFIGGWWYPMSRVRKNVRGEWELIPALDNQIVRVGEAERAVEAADVLAPIVADPTPTPEPETPTDQPSKASYDYRTKHVRARRGSDADGDKAAEDSDD